MAKSATAERTEEHGIGATLTAWPRRTRTFLQEVRNELRKVTTPSRKEVQATTVVVIITVFLFGLYFFLIDKVLGYGVDQLFRYFGR